VDTYSTPRDKVMNAREHEGIEVIQYERVEENKRKG
jgi:hypothetical protein